jgi:hypothetical protein
VVLRPKRTEVTQNSHSNRRFFVEIQSDGSRATTRQTFSASAQYMLLFVGRRLSQHYAWVNSCGNRLDYVPFYDCPPVLHAAGAASMLRPRLPDLLVFGPIDINFWNATC